MNRIAYLFFFAFLCSWTPSLATDSNCTNLGFELGNFTNWVGQTWLYSTEVSSINTSKSTGIVSRRQTIISDASAYDANTGGALKEIPSGYSYSARLGDEIISSDSNPRGWEQSLRYTMTIDSTNTLLIMKFACVLQYASDHTALMEPRFKLTLYDQSGNKISDCANYDVYASSGNSKFQTYTSSSSQSNPGGQSSSVKWRDWTTVGANLLAYVGQTITIEFMAADCTGRYHYGYAYFVAKCQAMSITVKYCAADPSAILTAPEGFESYSWTNSSGTVLGTSQILELSNPDEGSIYTCKMTSATGCTVTLHTTVIKYIPKADFSSYMVDCNSNAVQFTNLSTTNHGTLSYKWDFGDGTTSTEKNPLHIFTTSGMHQVGLKISNLPSACTDSINKAVESFSPPLVGITGDSTYCPTQTIILKAYGAYAYQWSTGSTADSIIVGTPGKYWLIGYSSTGCYSDTIVRNIIEEPDWTFTTTGDTTFCQGLSSILTASGAVKYTWSTGETANAITVNTAGTYTVTGGNARGCEKSHTYHVVVYPLPNADFTLSTTSVSLKHNQLTCSIPAENGVQYSWDLGDGFTSSNATVEHAYTISNTILAYTVSLLATNQYDCAKSSTQTIDMIPFIPNVFSPNNDGVNDLFMPDIDLQIVDRNGILLYKGTNGWDGTYKGKLVNPDTYFYLIKYTNKENQAQTKKGFITLVR